MTDANQPTADAYYGDEAVDDSELDLSFLDDTKDQPGGNDKKQP